MSETTTVTETKDLTPIYRNLAANLATRAEEIAAQPFQLPPSAQFNEADYLAKNPDVAAAVEAGVFPSGYAHYQQYGFREGRPGTPELVAPFTPDQEAAFAAARGVAGQAGDIYGQLATATGQSILPAAIQQTQDIGGALAGFARQGEQFLPGIAAAAQQGGEIAGQAGQFTGVQQGAVTGAQNIAGQAGQILPSMQGALAGAQNIAGQAGQFIPVQEQALSAAQGIAGQAGQYTPAFGSALGASQGLSAQAGQFLPMQAGAAQAAQGIAGQAGGITPIGQRAAQIGQNIAGVGTGILPTTLTGTAGLAQAFPGVNIGAYMNPYTEAVLQPALEDLAERAQIQQNALNSRAAMTGSFGGSRNALAQQQFERDLLRETGRLSAQERAKAFDVGAQQFRLDQTNIPALYEQMFGQLSAAQGLQRGATDIGTAALGQLTESQNLQRGVSDLAAQSLTGLGTAQGMEETNARLAQAGLTGLGSAVGLQRDVSDIGLQGLTALDRAQGLQKGVSDIGTANLSALGAAQGLERGVSEIANLGLEGLGAAQGLQRGAADLSKLGLSGLADMQALSLAPTAATGFASDLENRRLSQLAGLGAANASLLSTQVQPLLATGSAARALETERMNRMDALAAQQQDFPLRGFEVMRGALGLNTGGTSTRVTQQPQPNELAQWLGLGIGGISALSQSGPLFSGALNTINSGINAVSDAFTTYPSCCYANVQRLV